MKREVIIENLKNILKNNQFSALKKLVDDITEETSLINDLALDSIQILELVVEIEREFSFSCEPDELQLEMFDRVGTLIDFIESKCLSEIA